MTIRVLREDVGGLCTLTLNRPESLNALDIATFEALDAQFTSLERQTGITGCVVIRGAGRAFCAGADLKVMNNATIDPRTKPGVVERLARLPQPVIAAVHGVCYTGGLELALACDFILADATARFADTHGKWGLYGAWGMTQRLPRRIGSQAAKRLMMTAQPVGAAEAHRIGLVEQLAPAGGLDAMVAALAAQVLANSWHTNFAVKRLMRETEGMTIAEALAWETEHSPGNAADYKERIAAFSNKHR